MMAIGRAGISGENQGKHSISQNYCLVNYFYVKSCFLKSCAQLPSEITGQTGRILRHFAILHVPIQPFYNQSQTHFF